MRTHEEILATALLLGEPRPITCSLCRGRGVTNHGWFAPRKCIQCEGIGYEVLGPMTREALQENAA